MTSHEERLRMAGIMRDMAFGAVQGVRAIPGLVMRAGFTNAEALEHEALYPDWKAGVAYKAGWIVRHNGELYKVSSDITSSTPPPTTGYTAIPHTEGSSYPEWVPPEVPDDAYSYGDMVTCDGKTWVSIVPGDKTNVWRPGVYGWAEHLGGGELLQ